MACLVPPPLYVVMAIILLIRKRRGIRDLDPEAERRFWTVSLLWMGFLLHWVPFFIMKRQVCVTTDVIAASSHVLGEAGHLASD